MHFERRRMFWREEYFCSRAGVCGGNDERDGDDGKFLREGAIGWFLGAIAVDSTYENCSSWRGLF
jgi:hypothetical protein